MTRPRGHGKGALGRPGIVRWNPTGGSSSEDGLTQMAALLRDLTRWPLDQFASNWFPGDYRLLKFTSQGPPDVNGEATCQSSAAAPMTEVTVTAWVRSEGKTRPLNRSERAALAEVGFGIGQSGRGELIHANVRGQEVDLAERILRGMSNAFGTRGSVALRYRVESGSRLDAMPVFQDIREYELLSLLIAAGFDARRNDAGTSAEGRIPVITVLGATPFSIHMIEPSAGGYLTLRLEARFAGMSSSEAVETLNRASQPGSAGLENGDLVIRHQISVTGGVSHAGLRDRFDEWQGSLADVPQVIATRR